MCSWNSRLTPESRDTAEVLDDPQLRVRCTLHASPDEREEEYVRLFVSNPRREDPIFDAYLHEDEADGAAGDEQPDDKFVQLREDDPLRSPVTQDEHEESVEEPIDTGVETTVEGEADTAIGTGIGPTVEVSQEEIVDTGLHTPVEGEAEMAVDTRIGKMVDGDVEKADQPHKRTMRSVTWKDVQEQPKVFLRRSQWRKHIDATVFDLFREVDHVKDKEFSACVSHQLDHLKLKDAKQWFHDVFTEGAWLSDEHVDLAMQLLRQRTIKYPKSFGPLRVILDVNFYVNCMLAMLELDTTDHLTDLPEGFDSYLQGEFPKHGQKWEGCIHLYFSICSRSHWYAIEVDIAKSMMFIYDPDKSCSTDDQIRADLMPMTTILPMLLKKINIVIDALVIERITTTSKQSNS
ncbi:Ulp1 protease family protein [Abeliophyllum distichum]|uniref:Ulp1 protease family protein n=1 Tax=Abeliophyllum distichum TaxID=126358 RepID=A0ABD1Q5Q4_9LAMI